MQESRVRVAIRGAVQGVGFRPFVYRLAREMQLTGWVSNSAPGLFIEADGSVRDLQDFILRIGREHPARASIQSLEYSFLDPAGFRTFEIRPSDISGAKTALILPDSATCPDCLKEIFDSTNRRFRYPFTNCTHCGPRFTIIDALPYDRASTSMRNFTMCEECRREYEDPADRRFHAQPNACAVCGPQLEWWDGAGKVLSAGEDALKRAVDMVRSGKIVAMKGLGGFHLIANATNNDAVKRLRTRKCREEKPFAAMVPSIESAHDLCFIDGLEERALRAPEAPIVLLRRRENALAPSVAPGNPYLALMLPYTPLHHLLISEIGRPLVATSGNRSNEPICTDERVVLSRLQGIADGFLVHNRPIRRHADDSIVRVMLGREQVLRRARGYAPLPIRVRRSLPKLIGVGAQLKNTVAVALPSGISGETSVFLSQHIGDLESHEAFNAFKDTVADFQQLYEVRPEASVCDLHPDYLSSQYVGSRGGRCEKVQHHCAHVASCMAENELDGSVLGVAWDGAGLGWDGTIWGGEFLHTSGGGFKRVAHLRTFPLPGGDSAARRPRRSAMGLLYELFGEAAIENPGPLVLQMLKRRIQSRRTSSAGRLFDAIASIANVRHEATFEGQAAMALEFAVDDSICDFYPYAITGDDPMIADWEPMVVAILDDVRNCVPTGTIAARFHNTLAEIIVNVATIVGEARVVLSGGCFQNRYLTEKTVRGLSQAGFDPYWHQRVPTNDGGIALGQIAAAFIEEKQKLCASQSRGR